MNPTRQAIAELLVTYPDALIQAVESLVEVDAVSDFKDVLIPKLTIEADQSVQSAKALDKATTAITSLRILINAAKQNSEPHFFQGGQTNDDSKAA